QMSHYEKEIMKLRLELERGEAVRRGLECELSAARTEARLQTYTTEEELCHAKTKLVEMQVLHDKHQYKVAEAEKILHSAQRKWEEE
ncbi:CC171 protein, partial [Smithornis capensis]|nr:CC171 protein [Smithornis capensis]